MLGFFLFFLRYGTKMSSLGRPQIPPGPFASAQRGLGSSGTCDKCRSQVAQAPDWTRQARQELISKVTMAAPSHTTLWTAAYRDKEVGHLTVGSCVPESMCYNPGLHGFFLSTDG